MASRVVKGIELGVLAVLVVGLVAGAVKLRAQEPTLQARTAELTGRYNARARAALPRFLQDAAALQAEPIFKPTAQTFDAGPFLNQALPWRAGGVEITPGPRPLTLPAALEHKLNGWGTYWVGQADDVDVAALERSPLDPIGPATHWSLGAGEPGHDALPDFTLLQQWAKLILLRGMHRHQPQDASRDVFRLASLCASTQTLEGELAALGLLELLQKALGAPTQGLPAQRRVVRGAVAFAAPFVEPDVQRQAQQVTVGLCAAHDEASRFDAIRLALGLPPQMPTPPAGCQPSATRKRHAALPLEPQLLARLLHREPLLRGWQGKLRMRLFPEACARLLQAMVADDTGLRLYEHPDQE